MRIKRLIRTGFNDRPTGFFFGTATAPGADVLPWDKSKCRHRSDVRCSGKLGCRVVEIDAALWNTNAPQVWSWTMEEVRRRLPGVDVQFWKCWETQDRGVLHLHAIIWAAGVSQDRMRQVWHDVLAKSWSIGRQTFVWGEQATLDRIGCRQSVGELMEAFDLDPDEAQEMHVDLSDAERLRFMRYGAKYVTKGGKRATTICRRTGEFRHDGAGYRTWSASARWGDRMKAIRAEQRAWAMTNAGAVAGAPAPRPPGGGAALDPEPHFYAQGDDESLPTGVLELFGM